jgi:transposase
MTLSYSRALYLEFFFDQTMENFLRGHVHVHAVPWKLWRALPAERARITTVYVTAPGCGALTSKN